MAVTKSEKMATTTAEEITEIRPNIRIEIPNDVQQDEIMEVEEEEGEIVEEKTSQPDEFSIGLNIFDKAEQEKLQERARRFALKPEEIKNFNEDDLVDLYTSLGIDETNNGDVNFDTLYIYGIRGLTADDLLEYFAKYAPVEIQWIDTDSANVKWNEATSAARALFYNSRPVNGMPVREIVKTVDDGEILDGTSVLLRNRKVELDILSKKNVLKNGVDISEITIPIPPGYWRLGNPHPKNKNILLRYSLQSDQKPFRIENLSRLYRKLGTTLENQKKEIRGIFERNRQLNEKNPWGTLAMNWNRDRKFCEPERKPESQIEMPIRNPNLMERLGKKKPEVDEKEEETEKVRVPRMRMYADEEEEKVRRKKLLQALKKHTERLVEHPQPRDLRHVLKLNDAVQNNEVIVVDNESDENEADLSAKLRNRSRNMVFTIETGSRNEADDARALLDKRRKRHRSRSPVTRYRSPLRKTDRFLRGGTLHSDRMPIRHHHHHHHRHRGSSPQNEILNEDYFEPTKPRSRIAVVVRKPQPQPTVASRIGRRYESNSDSSSSEDSDETSSSSSSNSSDSSEDASDSAESTQDKRRKIRSAGFRGGGSGLRSRRSR